MKNIVFLSLVCIIFAGSVFLVRRYQTHRLENSFPSTKLKVAASFYPLAFFARQIGGEFVDVVNLTPAGAEPHDYEPTTGDIITIQNSNVLLLNGSGLEPWAEKLTGDLHKNNVRVIRLAEGLHYDNDPHVWLDPIISRALSEKITTTFMQVDPGHSMLYQQNAQKLYQKLERLDGEFRIGLQQCAFKTIVASHEAFGYLVRRYGFTQLAVSGISPDEEPSAKKLAEISDMVRKEGIRYIFFETLISPRAAKTIARETGAKTLVFNPIEGLTPDEVKNGEDYFSIQKKNLENLKRALACI